MEENLEDRGLNLRAENGLKNVGYRSYFSWDRWVSPTNRPTIRILTRPSAGKGLTHQRLSQYETTITRNQRYATVIFLNRDPY